MRRAPLLLALLALLAAAALLPAAPASAAPARAQLVVLATRGDATEPLAFELTTDAEGALLVAAPRAFAPARILHAPDGVVRGALAGNELLVIAEEDRGRDRSFAGALWRIGHTGAARVLDGLAFASRPLVVGRRVYLQRGRAGAEPRDGRMREDELALTELDLDTLARRDLVQLAGQLSYPVGVDAHAGLIAYLIGPPASAGAGGRLVAIDRATGSARDLGAIGSARDFSLAAHLRGANGLSAPAVVYEGRDAGGRMVAAFGLDGRRELLARGARMPLAPFLLPDGSVHLSAPGSHGSIDIVRAVDASGNLVLSQRYLPGRAEPELIVQRLLHGQQGVAVVIPAPQGARLEPIGFAELP